MRNLRTRATTYWGSRIAQRLQSWGLWVGVVMLVSWAIAQPAYAEGSIDLNPPGGIGSRPYLEFRNDNDPTSGILRRTTIKVYAEVGETINLGSSATGIDGATIAYRDPLGAAGACVAGVGLIANRAQELAGSGAVGGYVPCIVPVTTTGIWEIDFQSPDPDNQLDPPPLGVGAAWTQAAGVGWVAAWDATVSTGGALGAGGTAVSGRVFTNYLALNLGAFNAPFAADEIFFLTRDGYEYQFDSIDLQPFGFIFFANREGFLDPDGNPFYGSVAAGDLLVHNPGLPDNEATRDITQKLFFNRPAFTLPPSALAASELGGNTWLRTLPEQPPTPTNFSFTGSEGTAGASGNSPLGGTFSFNSSGPGTARLVIDFATPGVTNVEIFTQTVAGLNLVPWDGTDGDGNPAPAGTAAFNASLTLATGEVHFPLIDAEDNPSGFVINRLTSPGPDSSIVYYDDGAFEGEAGAPDPIRTPRPLEGGGIDSLAGAHSYTAGFGNNKGINTWVVVPGPSISLPGGITVRTADFKIEKGGAIAGTNITYTVTVTNEAIAAALGGSSPIITGAQFTDTVPAEVSNVSWTCVASAGSSCTANGQGNAIADTIALQVGGTVTYTITGTVVPGTTVVNTATITRPNDVTDPVDDDGESVGLGPNRTESDSITLPVDPIGPILGISKARGTVVSNGDGTFDVPFTIQVQNLGDQPIANLQLTENLFGSPDSAFNQADALSVIEPPTLVSGPLTLTNPNFNGNGDRNLLSGTETLGVGQQAFIQFTLLVTPGDFLGPYNNNVVGNGTAPNGDPVTDISTDQTDVPTPSPDPDGDGDPSNNSIPTVTNFGADPNLRLVKRITRVDRNGVPVPGINVGQFVNNSASANALDAAGLTPVGVVTIAPNVQLQNGDEVEYTLYFLSDGSTPALNVQICDQIPINSNFLPDGYAAGQGIQYRAPGTTAPSNQTNAADTDASRFFSPLAPLPDVCGPNENNGAVFVQVGNVSVNGLGLVRFRTRIP
ncbi:hypothetical protein ACQ4M4_09445 [Leptolyngbya sp. AN02str]|uniref:hypothetical protein n=1 Tax=Leptolyngbya sp. AN02str TaxID=3423363 RepID=UPI003D313808